MLKGIKLVIIGVIATIAATHPVTNEIITTVKGSNALWTPTEVEENIFQNYTDDQINNLLGLIITEPNELYPEVQVMATPDSFDSRQRWPTCIHPIRNQEGCGSCWAFGASEAFSDRICIASGKRTDVIISPQDLVSCDTTSHACKGGSLNSAWSYFEQYGSPSDTCEPYVSGHGSVPTCPSKCADGSTLKRYKCKAGSVQAAKGPDQIKTLILQSGPVETGFTVYKDFFSYKTGIYHHVTGDVAGGHAVKILGWGVDPNTKVSYWICANSWGPKWGDQGTFKIQQGECGIDHVSFGCTPSLTSSYEFLQ